MAITEIVLPRGTNDPDWKWIFPGINLTGSSIVLNATWFGGSLVQSTTEGNLVVEGSAVRWAHSALVANDIPLGRLTTFRLIRTIGSETSELDAGYITITSGPAAIVSNSAAVMVPGIQGPSGTLMIGEVETLGPGSSATVENVGTPENAVLNVGIPRGDKGETPDISILSTTTLAPGSQATVALDPSSTAEAPRLNFGIPRGDTGDTGTAATIVIAGTDTLAPGAPATVVNEGTSAAASLRVGIPAGVQGIPGAPGEPLVLVVSDMTDIGLGGWWAARDYHGAATCDYLRAEMLVGEADGVTLSVRKNGATVRSGIPLGAGTTIITDLGLVLAEEDQVSVHRVGGGTLTGPWVMLVQIDGRAP